MKKKLFRSFIVSLFVFTLFISVSNAAITANNEYELSGISATTTNASVSNFFSGQTNETVSALLKAYRDDPSATTFNAIYDLFITSNADYNYGVCRTSSSGYVVYTAYAENNSDFSVSLDSAGVPDCIMSLPDSSTGSQTYYVLSLDPSNTLTFQKKVVTYRYVVYEELTSNYIYYYKLPNPVKQMTYDATKDSYKWDGSSYYTQPAMDVPAGPEFTTELTDDEIADVVKNFSNSTYWKNRNSNYTGFFIQRNELNGNYAVFVVPYGMITYKFLDGIYIPKGVCSIDFTSVDYDSYTILYNDGNYGFQFPWNEWLSCFKAYLSYDGINFDYQGEIHVKDFSQYRIPMTTPIIYSSFTIPFKTLIGETIDDSGDVVNSYTEEIDYDFSNLVNSETGESYEFEDVPVEDNPIIRALGEFFNDLTGYLSSAFEFVLNKIFNFSEYLLSEFGENVFTLLFAIIIEAFSALVAGISLLVRFAGFILTLVAIPADSSLFNVLVDGSAWGTHFIEGLNFLKGLSWNNLNLWTFFECFVAALEVIWTVRIVRRHYSQVV